MPCSCLCLGRWRQHAGWGSCVCVPVYVLVCVYVCAAVTVKRDRCVCGWCVAATGPEVCQCSAHGATPYHPPSPPSHTPPACLTGAWGCGGRGHATEAPRPAYAPGLSWRELKWAACFPHIRIDPRVVCPPTEPAPQQTIDSVCVCVRESACDAKWQPPRPASPPGAVSVSLSPVPPFILPLPLLPS